MSENRSDPGASVDDRETSESEGLEIYDPMRDDHQEEEDKKKIEIQNANWFWHFLGCAQRETNLFYSQNADGIFGIMSLYENFDYLKRIEEQEGKKKSERRAHEINRKIVKEVIDDELKNIVRDKSKERGFSHYSNEHVPSILNDLLVQKKIKKRKFAICLGYNKGFLNFNGWNSRTLRILNYKQIENKLIEKYQTSEDTRLLMRNLREINKSNAKTKQKKFEWSEKFQSIENVQEKNEQNLRKNIKKKLDENLRKLVEEISEESESEDAAEDNEPNPLLKMNKVEEKAIQVLEELSGAEIISDKIQHIHIPPLSRFQFLYTGLV